MAAVPILIFMRYPSYGYTLYISVASLLLSLSLCINAFPAQSRYLEEDFKRAVSLFESMKYKDAILLFKNIIRIEKDRSEFRLTPFAEIYIEKIKKLDIDKEGEYIGPVQASLRDIEYLRARTPSGSFYKEQEGLDDGTGKGFESSDDAMLGFPDDKRFKDIVREIRHYKNWETVK